MSRYLYEDTVFFAVQLKLMYFKSRGETHHFIFSSPKRSSTCLGTNLDSTSATNYCPDLVTKQQAYAGGGGGSREPSDSWKAGTRYPDPRFTN